MVWEMMILTMLVKRRGEKIAISREVGKEARRNA